MLTSKKAGVGAATGQETHELGLSSRKRRQAGLGEHIRVLQAQAAKPTLTNLSKKGKILARNWVIERRDKRLKKQVLKGERNQDRGNDLLVSLSPAAEIRGPPKPPPRLYPKGERSWGPSGTRNGSRTNTKPNQCPLKGPQPDDPPQTPGMIPVELLRLLQMSRKVGATQRHTRTPTNPSLQTGFPYHRVTVAVVQGQVGNSVSGFQPGT